MKVRYFQPQFFTDTKASAQSSRLVRHWYDDGPPVLQYEEDGHWYEVPTVQQREEGHYDGEREMR